MKPRSFPGLWPRARALEEAVRAWVCVCVCVCVGLIEWVCVCVQRERERWRRISRSGRPVRRMLEGNARRTRGWDLSKGAGAAVRPVLQGGGAGRPLPGLHLLLQGPGQTQIHGLRSDSGRSGSQRGSIRRCETRLLYPEAVASNSCEVQSLH